MRAADGKRMLRKFAAIIVLLALACLLSTSSGGISLERANGPSSSPAQEAGSWFDVSDVPSYSGKPSVAVNGNVPRFTSVDRVRASFEEYSELDALGRCGVAFALVGPETMPAGERGEIGDVKPTGWHIATYDWVDGRYLYNRCHLIGWQLAGENANPKNLITGTRYLNVDGMLPYENEVADYVQRTGHHVLYRVTPVFQGRDMLASGVLMEAESAEDSGAGVRFCTWCYNVQPGVEIDYATGQSHAAR